MYENELYHHGILGQKWGVRRYQNDDGSLTNAGKKRYGVSDSKPRTAKQYSRELNDIDQAIAYNKRDLKELQTKQNKVMKKSKRYLVGDNNGNNQYAFPTDNKRAQKLKNKMLDNHSKMQEIANRINEGYYKTTQIVKEAQENGFTVNSRKGIRSTMRGKDYVGSALWGSIPYTMANLKYINIDDQTYYKVKSNK